MRTSTLITHSPDRDLRGEDWTIQAACAADPELMYTPGDSWEGHHEQRREALAMCAACPVLAECDEWMRTTAMGDKHAIIAGTTPSMRESLRRASTRPSRRRK